MTWNITDSLDLYNVEGWGIGYFGIDERGHLNVHPTQDPGRGLDLYEMAMDLEEQGVTLPVLLRFSDILRHRIESLTGRFRSAREEFGYEGDYSLVYPIKVNQQRHVVEEILSFGQEEGVGLEVGSKPELMAVLALTERTDHLIICNGYKDEEYVRLALMGQKLGHEVLIVVEKISEVETVLRVAEEMDVVPGVGVRVKLSSAGAGRWHLTAGERSKFGLTASQLMRVVELLREADRLDAFRMIHFHIGSQVPDIHSVKSAMTEVARFYVELRQLGVDLRYVDVGGGLGVDYDGTRSTGAASVNYSIQEYANDIV
ncbi:MAG TPA: biosynthetic arginine decarboxylase, partial [Longimicrobiales bacterium]|nr:biosynthetic arginine decarboxylase [Longimicrobiales bacterium]